MNTKKWLGILAAVLVALAAGIGAYTQTDTGPSTPPGQQDGRSSWGKPAATPTPAQVAPTSSPPPLAGAEHENLSEPGDVDLGTLRGAAPVSDSLPGCVNRFNTHNYSSRGGTPVREVTAHYTVSRNVPGWADVDANVDFLNRASTKASAFAIIDDEGHCAYTVPLRYSAWTEAGGNRFSAGIEFVGMGDEGKLSPAALKEGGAVIAAVAERSEFPIQLGDVTNCQPNRPGVVDHAMYGPCGGGHHDLRPYYGSSVVPRASDNVKVLGPLIAAARAAAAPPDPLTGGERAAEKALVAERAIAKRHGGWDKVASSHLQRAVAAKDALRRANLRLHAAAAKTGWDRLNRRARHARIHALI